MTDRKLVVAHVCPATPHQCGMWETVREMVMAENATGKIKAYVYDPRPKKGDVADVNVLPEHSEEVGCPHCGKKFMVSAGKPMEIPTCPPAWSGVQEVCICPKEFLPNVDVVISHSGGEDAEALDKPIIHVAHGRPNSSYRLERYENRPVYSTYVKFRSKRHYRVMVTLWPGFGRYLKLLFPRVVEAPAIVDLNAWTPGNSTYDFGDKSGSPNIVCTDIWRSDKDPYYVLHGALAFKEKYAPDAKVHIYGQDQQGKGRDVLLDVLSERGLIGKREGFHIALRNVYRKADMLITPHTMATRTIREALACGLTVVAGQRNPYTPFACDPEDVDGYAEQINFAWKAVQADRSRCISANRKVAERVFAPELLGNAMAEIITQVYYQWQEERVKASMKKQAVQELTAAQSI